MEAFFIRIGYQVEEFERVQKGSPNESLLQDQCATFLHFEQAKKPHRHPLTVVIYRIPAGNQAFVEVHSSP